jgi:hypothetical protein
LLISCFPALTLLTSCFSALCMHAHFLFSFSIHACSLPVFLVLLHKQSFLLLAHLIFHLHSLPVYFSCYFLLISYSFSCTPSALGPLSLPVYLLPSIFTYVLFSLARHSCALPVYVYTCMSSFMRTSCLRVHMHVLIHAHFLFTCTHACPHSCSLHVYVYTYMSSFMFTSC